MLDLTGYKLTFSDEFNSRSISQNGVGTTWADIRSQWRFDSSSDIGFGHSSFVDPASGYDPFKVQGGALSITAVPDRTASGYPGSWESGLITTQGNFSQTYGYFEMRADLADAKGGWDAFWLLPNKAAANPTNLPGWQELDIVEHYGAYNQGTYRWIHTTDPDPNKNPNADLQVFSNNPTQVSGYHTYGMDWQKDKISFYFDGQLMGSRATPSDMHGPMYLLANLATQSDADEAGVPMTMKVDYIRAYSKDSDSAAITQDTISSPDGQDPGLYGAAAVPVVSAATPTAPATSVSSTPIASPAVVIPIETSPAVAIAPVASPPIAGEVTAVYRFYDTHTGDHFYTTSTAEKAQIQQTLPWFNYEGTPWAAPAKGADTVDVFRFFDTVSNAHFFTTSVSERDQVLKTAPSYKYEGVAFEAYADASAPGGLTLERFYNTQTGQHHFAGSAEEANGINHGVAGPGWVDEGKAFTVHLSTDTMLFA